MAVESSCPSVPPSLLLLGSMVSVQWGAALAKPMMVELTPAGVVVLRLGFAALVLMLIQRPWLHPPSTANSRSLVWFGLTMAVMNGFFYAAIARIPLGIAVTIEFLGPLGVALYHSRRRLDLLWVLLAAIGIALLMPLPGSTLDPIGLLFALIAAVGWAGYILAAAQAGKEMTGPVLPWVLAIAGLCVLPFGWNSLGVAIAQPRLLTMGLFVAVLSSVLPYSLEFAALKRMSVQVFGVMLSLEGAIASLISFLLLGETLTPSAMMAVLLVSLAAAGASYGERLGG